MRCCAAFPDGWIAANEGSETWSPFDVIGHLIHGERTGWMPRARIVLEHGEGRPFDVFDRFAQFAASEGRTLAGQHSHEVGPWRAYLRIISGTEG